jgi:polygalacturonase
MKALKLLSDVIHYLAEGTTRLFSPHHDEYPEIGVQPFDGDSYSKTLPPRH